MRLAGCMANLGFSTGGSGAKDRRLGAGYGSLVEIHRRAAKPVRRVERVSRLVRHACPECKERLHVRRDRPARGEIASGRSEACRAAPGQERPEQQHRTAQPADEHWIGSIARHRRAAHRDGRRADAANGCSETRQERRHRFHVAYARDVLEHALLIGQETRRQERQRGILVALYVDASLERAATLDSQHGHG